VQVIVNTNLHVFQWQRSHYEFDFHSHGSFCVGLVSRQIIRVSM